MTGTAAQLIARSNRLGSDPRNTNYASGNTAPKGTSLDPVTREPTELLWINGSGGDLGTLAESVLTEFRLDRLRALSDAYQCIDHENKMVAAFDHTLHRKSGAAPSIDTAMHGLVDVANAVFVLCPSDLSHTTGVHIPVDAGVAAAFLR
ncbi:MAG TPA: hypothetical protein VFJ19_01325 [Nocardioidaceae bacterium]|nr:hypothetical protein [Nocardioidaceae bacterium]